VTPRISFPLFRADQVVDSFKMMELERTKVIQVTNIAPQATRDQMHTLFSHLGKIEDIRLYPSLRDASINIQSRVCFVKFLEDTILPTCLHMTNTVFIDRAIIVQPFMNGDIPDELSGLEFANSSMPRGESKLPGHVVSRMEAGKIVTVDDSLLEQGLPSLPSLPGDTDEKTVEEIRRTIVVMGIGASSSAQDVMDYFATGAGEVKYFRWCSKEGADEGSRFALVEFSDYGAVPAAMRLNNTMLGDFTVKVYYSSQAITKPQAKSNEAALKEIEEAMKKVKEAQSLVNSAVDPLMSVLGVKGKPSRSRSRTPSRNRDYRRRSRSRSRDRYYRRRSRSRDRRRSRSRERRRRSRSRKRSRSRRRSRTRSRDRKRDERKSEKKEETSAEEPKNGVTEAVKAEGDNGTNGVETTEKKRSRSKSGSRRRSRSRERRRSRSRERRRSRSKSRKRSKRSRSRERRRRSRSRDRRRSRSRSKRRSRSRDHKSKKSKRDRRSPDREEKKSGVKRDYDQEEAGYENKKDEKHETVDMEISNSP